MARVELWMSLLAGFAGGLVGTLWGTTVSSSLLERLRGTSERVVQQETVGRLLAGAALYGACGMTLGFLFWLSWGLAAIVAAPWPAVGCVFGLLCWAGGALPVLGMVQLRLRNPNRLAGVLAIEWLVACLAIGVFCAFAWQRSA